MAEYIIWGLSPKNPEHEQPLVTRLNSEAQAQAVIEILRADHGCTDLRVQILDLSADPSNLFRSSDILGS